MENSFTAEDLGIDFGNVEMNFGDEEQSNDNGCASSFQEMYDSILAQKKQELEDGKKYLAKLKETRTGVTSSKHHQSLDMIYDVFNGEYIQEAIDTYVFDKNNEAYFKFTLNRLIKTFENYGCSLSRSDLNNLATMESACQKLIGKEVIIEQYDYNGYKKYKVYAR